MAELEGKVETCEGPGVMAELEAEVETSKVWLKVHTEKLCRGASFKGAVGILCWTPEALRQGVRLQP